MSEEPSQFQSVIDHHTRTIINLCKATGEMMHPDLCRELRNYMPDDQQEFVPSRYTFITIEDQRLARARKLGEFTGTWLVRIVLIGIACAMVWAIH